MEDGSLWGLMGGDFLSLSLEDLGAQLTQETWEWVATKADDADVPTHLWVQHCLDDFPGSWLPAQAAGMPRLMRALEPLAHRWWCRSLRRSYFAWARGLRPQQYRKAKILHAVEWCPT